MSAPRRVLECTADDCGSAWYQFSDDHAYAIRQAIKAGWSSEWGGCVCAGRQQRCPEHPAPVADPDDTKDGA